MTQIATFIPREKCFFQLSGQNRSNGLDVQFVFKNNSADTAGSVDNCTLTGLDSYNSGLVLDKLVHYEADNTASSISSNPFHICLCNLNNRHSSCSQSMKTMSVYPGETFQVSVGHCWSERWNSSYISQKPFRQRQACKFSVYSTDNKNVH